MDHHAGGGGYARDVGGSGSFLVVGAMVQKMYHSTGVYPTSWNGVFLVFLLYKVVSWVR